MKRYIRAIVGIIFLLLGIASFGNSIAVGGRGITFAGFFTILGIFFTLIGICTMFFIERMEIKFPKLIKAIKIIFISGLTVFLIIEVVIIAYGAKSDTERTDYLIVLGAGLYGETPSLVLTERLDAAVSYLQRNSVKKIIVSGGQGPGENISEAEAMKRYLVAHGIEESKILEEDKSTSTAENIELSKKILIDESSGKPFSTAIVTNDFHMFRAVLLARHAGLTVYKVPAKLALWLVPTYYIRESIAVLKQLFYIIID